MTNRPSNQLIRVLRDIGNTKCVQKAENLQKKTTPLQSLHLRDFNLSASNTIAIAECLKHENEFLTSISFSYNELLGDAGAIALFENLSKHISEIGLVNCGISDIGGVEIFNWIKNATQLRMICIEQNNFSEELISKFKLFSETNPQVLVVV